MSFWRKLGIFLSSTFLKLSLFGLAAAFALVTVLGTPDRLKESFGQSGLYKGTVENILVATQQENDQTAGSIPLDRPEIKQAAQTAFPPQKLKIWTEEFIDGIYRWLNGDSTNLEFTIDMTQSKRTFAEGVGNYVAARLESLPPCTRKENLALSRQSVDPFNVHCRPLINVAEVRNQVITEIENSQEFLGDTVITAEDLSQADRQALKTDSNSVPRAFQWVRRLPIILILISLLLAGAIIQLSQTKRRGLKQVGKIMLVAGVFLFISTLIIIYFANNALRSDGTVGKLVNVPDNYFQAGLMEVSNLLFKAFNKVIIVIAVIYTIIGGATLLALRFGFKKSSTNKP